MEDPPYARIVAELRDRIDAGALAPGDRVPSTREITRQWGVAMATATKALTTLRQAGLVRSVPGIGTVVNTAPIEEKPGQAPMAHRRPPSDAALTVERIVTAAMAIADAEGLPSVSMRRIATEIGAATMSLYRHVADKDDLLMRMMDAAMAEWRFPAESPTDWRARLELGGRMLWATFTRHPWLAPALSVTRPQPIAGGLAFTEWVLAALTDSGLDMSTVFTAYITMVNYIRGTAVNLELEAEAEAASGMDNDTWMDTQEAAMRSIVGTGRFPVFERLISVEYDFDLDHLFEFGLQRLLDGLEVLITSATPPA
ncbi:MAG TPA: TetR/AcrR family transcriptional regulator C-terminal domain-containing protein [Pseudonocardiaceae bacterium]